MRSKLSRKLTGLRMKLHIDGGYNPLVFFSTRCSVSLIQLLAAVNVCLGNMLALFGGVLVPGFPSVR